MTELELELQAERAWSSRGLMVLRLLDYLMKERGKRFMAKATGKTPNKRTWSKMSAVDFFKLCLDVQKCGAAYVKEGKLLEAKAEELSKKLGFDVAPGYLKRAQTATGFFWGAPIGPRKRLEMLSDKAKELGYSSIEDALAALAHAKK